uniref:Uncharacterized protein n=1 Tax=Anguilla anguilla TaxID=7936 RepID=A0A0E9S9L0_ANGAN
MVMLQNLASVCLSVCKQQQKKRRKTKTEDDALIHPLPVCLFLWTALLVTLEASDGTTAQRHQCLSFGFHYHTCGTKGLFILFFIFVQEQNGYGVKCTQALNRL